MIIGEPLGVYKVALSLDAGGLRVEFNTHKYSNTGLEIDISTSYSAIHAELSKPVRGPFDLTRDC